MCNGLSLMNTNALQGVDKDIVSKLKAKSGMKTTFSTLF